MTAILHLAERWRPAEFSVHSHSRATIPDAWVNHREQDAIAYLRTEIRLLQEKLGKKRTLLNDDQRRRLAVKGKILGREMLEELAGIVTPETILR